MKLNVEKLKELMEKKFDSNYHLFAKALNIDAAHIHRILNDKRGAGVKVISGIMNYCKENNIPFEEYIFFDLTVE